MTWTVANTVMIVLFVFAALVQVNDPDPAAWILIYGLAVVASVLALLRRGHWLVPAAIATLAFVWAATIAPGVLGEVPFLDMFGAFEMRDIGIEESREMYGLLLVAGWLALLAVRARRRTDPDGRRPGIQSS